MDEKTSAAEQAFEEWWDKPRLIPLPSDELGAVPIVRAFAEQAYLAATERTARRCMEICREQLGPRVRLECARAIAKEFGLD
jgi:hypothetical protein